MLTMILISSVAVVVAIVGCIVIWGLDARRATEIEHEHELEHDIARSAA